MVLGHPVLNFMVLVVCVNCDLFSLHHTIGRISCAFITSLVSPNLEKDCMWLWLGLRSVSVSEGILNCRR